MLIIFLSLYLLKIEQKDTEADFRELERFSTIILSGSKKKKTLEN